MKKPGRVTMPVTLGVESKTNCGEKRNEDLAWKA